MNTQHCKSKNETQYTSVPSVTYTRFNITEDTKEKKYRVQYRDHTGKSITKNFGYARKGKAATYKEAEAFRANLIKEYYK